ncbi:DUF3558 domain-containing protein [Saccharothrix sp. HUAS TT1]|uniref:DUF3558 domain-containing protein n=1 Tax=unclassified Saccharothrix TaxID=2593673 RepID=UPI00345BC336
MNFRMAAVGLAATFLAVTACGGPIQGKPSANVGGSPSTSTGKTSTTTGSASPTLEDADPCELLTVAEVERVADKLADEPARNDLGTARGCEYNVNGRPLSVDIRTNVGLAGVNPTGPVTDHTIGGHEAKVWVSPYGSCFFILGVTASSRVDVVFTAKPGEDSCGFAKRLAELVEPKLP